MVAVALRWPGAAARAALGRQLGTHEPVRMAHRRGGERYWWSPDDVDRRCHPGPDECAHRAGSRTAPALPHRIGDHRNSDVAIPTRTVARNLLNTVRAVWPRLGCRWPEE